MLLLKIIWHDLHNYLQSPPGALTVHQYVTQQAYKHKWFWEKPVHKIMAPEKGPETLNLIWRSRWLKVEYAAGASLLYLWRPVCRYSLLGLCPFCYCITPRGAVSWCFLFDFFPLLQNTSCLRFPISGRVVQNNLFAFPDIWGGPYLETIKYGILLHVASVQCVCAHFLDRNFPVRIVDKMPHTPNGARWLTMYASSP